MHLNRINDSTAVDDNNVTWFKKVLKTPHRTWKTCSLCEKKTNEYWETWPKKFEFLVCEKCIEWKENG